MPREQLAITLFDKGLVTSVDPEDIDINAMSYSENLDANANGKLQGIPVSAAIVDTYGKDYVRGAFIRRLTGEYDLIYSNGTNIYAVTDFYGTRALSSALVSQPGFAFTKQNRGVYIGIGNDSAHPSKWIGYVDYQPFGGINQLVYTSSGTISNDLTASGNYAGAANAAYYFQIYSVGTPDQFQWNKNGGAWSSPISITGGLQYIAEGIYVKFGSTVGHHVNGVSGAIYTDTWTLPTAILVGGLLTYSAQLQTYEGSGSAQFTIGQTSAGTGAYKHRYKYSLSYGADESTLSVAYTDTLNGSNTFFTDSVYILANGGLSSRLNFDNRITAVNVYVALSTDTTAANLGSYSLVMSIPFTYTNNNSNQFFFTPSTGTTITNTGADMICLTPTLNSLGATYTANTGLPDDADLVTLNYKLGCELNGYAFVCNAYEPNLPSAGLMLFKSKAGAYGTFDVVNDILWLNFLPVAMQPFNGKLYIWDSHNTYIINPDTLYIEDKIPGYGCASDLSCTVFDIEESHVLVFSDLNNVYMTNGAGIIPIGDTIKNKADANGVDWVTSSPTSAIIVYDAVKQLILCSLTVSGSTNVFAYHITKKRWDYFKDFAGVTTTLTGMLTGASQGETYACTGAAILNNFNGTTFRAWIYISPEITSGSPSQKKIYYELYQDAGGTGTVTPYYSVNKGSTFNALTSSTQIKTGSAWVTNNSIRLKLSGAAGTEYVDAITLLLRQMIGVR